jgi:hypothetical protein
MLNVQITVTTYFTAHYWVLIWVLERSILESARGGIISILESYQTSYGLDRSIVQDYLSERESWVFILYSTAYVAAAA